MTQGRGTCGTFKAFNLMYLHIIFEKLKQNCAHERPPPTNKSLKFEAKTVNYAS